ncbi:hypothetical protein AAF134_14430 [Synechococcus lacustris Tous-12m]
MQAIISSIWAVGGPFALVILSSANLLFTPAAKAQTMITVEPYQLPTGVTTTPSPRSTWRLRGAAYLEDPWHRLPLANNREPNYPGPYRLIHTPIQAKGCSYGKIF